MLAGFNITYLDRRNIQGDYFNDTVTVAGRAVQSQQLGLALRSVRGTGIMGLGFAANVAAGTPYPTVVDNMVRQGLIDAPTFSLYLNDVDAKSGTILFGGIDSQKYVGNLVSLPLLPVAAGTGSSSPGADGSANNITTYSVRLEGVSVRSGAGGSGYGLDGLGLGNMDARAILDSGSTITLLPDALVGRIHRALGVRAVDGVAAPLVDCAWRRARGAGTSFDFDFGAGLVVRVPARYMVVDAFPPEVQQPLRDSDLGRYFRAWDGVCVFGIASAYDYGIASDRFALLGDTFLRSAYVVYDMANRQLAIAPANPNSDRSSIVAVRKNDKNLPNVTGVSPKESASTSLPCSGPAAIAALLLFLLLPALAAAL
ncbi:hypothetical protein CDD83_7917 [Cordyceps sp. RAO-2017]|nr:hypothetical protein CDD83_7917 [Cordyceps sp. RAO-2017]